MGNSRPASEDSQSYMAMAFGCFLKTSRQEIGNAGAHVLDGLPQGTQSRHQAEGLD